MDELLLQNMDARRFGALFPKLAETVRGLLPAADHIAPERKRLLIDTAGFITSRTGADSGAPLVFICTHNSRRSHLCQIWAHTFAWLYGLDHVTCFSGGTEATAFHPNAVRALESCGFHISSDSTSRNPHRRVTFSSLAESMEAWSKTYDDPANPTAGFAAVMTCSDADEACPVVPGAVARFPIRYDDPKVADDTPHEAEVYLQRCRQIAAEMFFLMNEVRHGDE